MRRPLLLAVLVSTACAAHEPTPRIHAPDEPAAPEPGDGRQLPSTAEFEGTGTVAETESLADRPASEQGQAGPVKPGESLAAGEPQDGPVKQIESREEDAYERGKRDALAAIATDALGLETFGYPAPCRYKYAQILRQEYKVTLHEVAGCVIDDTIAEHARGYNEVMRVEIERRHGPTVFKKASRKAGC